MGGKGVAGGGSGGRSYGINDGQLYGQDGTAGYASPGQYLVGGTGGGEGNVNAISSTFSGNSSAPAGGGGGHTTLGTAGTGIVSGNTGLAGPLRGGGGDTYPSGSNANRMLMPSAGSGGGAGGYNMVSGGGTFGGYDATGGAGGAGGGFVDVTSGGNISIFGTLDAAGSRGGSGAAGFYTGSGGGGGGSGGGIRLLTPNDIDVTGGTITAAGGQGGGGAIPSGGAGTPNTGGNGGLGRIVMEDADSVITGLGVAMVTPGEGAEGFFRGPFDAGRFQGGGLDPSALTELFVVGPFAPTFSDPVQTDFVAGIPAVASRGLNMSSILIEGQGYPIKPDGTPDLTSPTGWYTIGVLRDSGATTNPEWRSGELFGNPGDIAIPLGNVGAGITNLNGSAFLQLRISMLLPAGVGPFDPGPYLDSIRLPLAYDQ
jgi:hypothetical protein